MMAGSGHIAGVINHPDAHKYQHWTNDKLPEKVEDWIAGATETPGSWWPHGTNGSRNSAAKKSPPAPQATTNSRSSNPRPARYAKMK